MGERKQKCYEASSSSSSSSLLLLFKEHLLYADPPGDDLPVAQELVPAHEQDPGLPALDHGLQRDDRPPTLSWWVDSLQLSLGGSFLAVGQIMEGDERAAIVFAVAFIGHDAELVRGLLRIDWLVLLWRQVLNTRCGRMLSTLPLRVMLMIMMMMMRMMMISMRLQKQRNV